MGDVLLRFRAEASLLSKAEIGKWTSKTTT
jgi:hypothetical protein